jgi:hypothetical protein
VKRRNHIPEQGVRKVAEGQKLLAEGRSVDWLGSCTAASDTTVTITRRPLGGTAKKNFLQRLTSSAVGCLSQGRDEYDDDHDDDGQEQEGPPRLEVGITVR